MQSLKASGLLIEAHGADVSIEIRLFEWKNLVTGKKTALVAACCLLINNIRFSAIFLVLLYTVGY